MFYAVSSSTSGTAFTIPLSGLSLDCVPSLLQISARLAVSVILLNHLFNQFQIVRTWFQGQSAPCQS